jgi:hypothetical protein
MSDEESDEDEHGAILRVYKPAWRSLSLSTFLHSFSSISGRNSLRRKQEVNQSSDTTLIMGLPINCYSERWLRGFAAERQVRKQAKGPVDFYKISGSVVTLEVAT